jgi:peroxiredoxin
MRKVRRGPVGRIGPTPEGQSVPRFACCLLAKARRFPLATPVAEGSKAPEFSLPKRPDAKMSLRELRGRRVILAFYPADWSPVCGDQVSLYNEVMDEFDRYDAQLVGISVDGPWSHLAFSEHRRLRFPLLADFEPKGAVAKQYGVYREGDGTSERALFVIDREGGVAWSYVSPIDVNPGADGIIEALDRLDERGSQ